MDQLSQKSVIMCEFYIALTSLVGEYFPGEQMRSIMHVIDLVFYYRIDQLDRKALLCRNDMHCFNLFLR